MGINLSRGFDYNLNGSLTRVFDTASQTDIATYSYDAEDRLTSVWDGITTTSYGYDGDGNRYQQTTGGVTTDYLLDINRGLTEVIGAITPGSETYYLLGLDMLGQQDITTSTATWSYYGADHLGSVRTLTDAAGGLTAHTSYDPYGNLLHHAQQPDTPATSLGYTGEMTDGNGLVYLRARYYNPATATFLTRDPFPGYAHLALSRNGYSYVHGNPINHVDPSGEFIVAAIVGGIIIAGVTGAAYNVFVEQGYGKGGKCSNGETNFFRILDNARRNADRGEAFRRATQSAVIGGIVAAIAGGAAVAVGGIPGLYTSLVSLGALGSAGIQKATEALVKLGDSEIVHNIQSTAQQGAQWVGSLFSGSSTPTTTFFHGTSPGYAESILNNGIDLVFGRYNADFGSGFYMSTSPVTAASSASRLYGEQIDIVEFVVPNDLLENLSSLNFSTPDMLWSDFVRFHKFYSPQTLMHGGELYDIVTGPMFGHITSTGNVSALPDSIQTSIHTQHAVDLFNKYMVR